MSQPSDRGDITMGDLSQPVDELDAQRVFANLSEALFEREVEPARVGRFVLLERVGTGGMGTVYAAFDPTLDRKVAIKLLHPDPRADEDEARARDLLRREARALARLRHPNVVTVHEVGTVGEQTFVAMEYVRGQSLDAWLTEARPWRKIVRVFIEAGRGLIAAHAAGLVHRDFKPQNAVLDEDGRVIVVDFGLARIDPRQRPELAGDSLVDARTRSVAGTPAYMAPEQHRGEPADAKSDQFSFCLSLWEALFGQRPFEAPTPILLLEHIDERRVVPPPASRPAPRWLRRALRRGLEPEAADRWPSVQALLDELERGLAAPGRRLALGAGGVMAVAALAWAVGRGDARPSTEPTVDPCEAVMAAVDEVWDDARAATITAGLSTADAADPERGGRVAEGLGRYAAAWREARGAACHEPVPPDPRRRACYDARLDDLRAAVELLQAPDALLQARALELVPTAASLAECDVRAGPDAAGGEPGEAWAEGSRALARAKTLTMAGRYEDAAAQAEQALELARAHDDATLRSRALVQLGRLSIASGDKPQAVKRLREALVAAERSADTVARLEALRGLAEALIETADLDQAEHALAIASAAYGRFEPRPPLWDAQLARLRGELALARHDLDTAGVELRSALAIAQADPETRAADVLVIRTRLASLHLRAQRWAEAETELREAAAAIRRHLGPQTPGLAATLSTLGGLMLTRTDGHADLDAAEASLTEAMEIRTRLVGDDDPSLIKTLQNLAAVHSKAKRTQEALAVMERSLAIMRKHDIRTFNTTQALRNTAIVLTHLQRWEQAAERYREACELLAEIRTDDPTARQLREQAAQRQERGEFDQATDLYRQAYEAIVQRDRKAAQAG